MPRFHPSCMTYLRLAGKDRSKVDLTDEEAVRYWMRHLGATERDLRWAVKSVGKRPAKVQDYLRGKALQDAWR